VLCYMLVSSILWEQEGREKRSGLLGDVVKQLSEESYLKKLVKCNKLLVGDAFVTDARWWTTIGERSMGILLYLREGILAGIREAILQREVDPFWRVVGVALVSRRGGSERSEGSEGNDRLHDETGLSLIFVGLILLLLLKTGDVIGNEGK
jgi:hypothetical protein